MTIYAYMTPEADIVPARSEALAEAYAAQCGGRALKAEVPDTAWQLTDESTKEICSSMEVSCGVACDV